jgi:hypothetical protein
MDFEQRFERKMEFILDTLASVSAKNGETAALLSKLTARQDKADRQIEAIRKLVVTGMKMMVQIQASQKELAKQQGELTKQQARTEDKLQRWLDSLRGPNGHKNGRNGGKNRAS